MAVKRLKRCRKGTGVWMSAGGSEYREGIDNDSGENVKGGRPFDRLRIRDVYKRQVILCVNEAAPYADVLIFALDLENESLDETQFVLVIATQVPFAQFSGLYWEFNYERQE